MGQVHRIHPNRDEGQDDANPKRLELEDLRGAILSMISDSGSGGATWSKAKALADKMRPMTLSPSTIIKFATGKTDQPEAWTIRLLADQVDLVPVLMPKGAKLPKGAVRLK